MVNTDAILINLNGFLFSADTADLIPSTLAYLPVNEEAKQLLLDMQEYSAIIGTCDIPPNAVKALVPRLEKEGIKMERLFPNSLPSYSALRQKVFYTCKERYHISCYIDEMEDSPWQSEPSLNRLIF